MSAQRIQVFIVHGIKMTKNYRNIIWFIWTQIVSFLITTFSAVVLPFWQMQCFSFESNIEGKSSLFVVSVAASMVLLSKACAVFHHGRYKETTSHPIFGQFHYLNIVSKFFLTKYSKRNMLALK